MNFFKLNKELHRDLGYLLVGMIIIYALSGIALNHKDDWNPDYIIKNQDVGLDFEVKKNAINQELINRIINKTGMDGGYKKHYFPEENKLKIFIENGSITVNLDSSDCQLETISKRPIFNQVNLLHQNPGKIWKYFSDIFSIALILLSISGLFMLKGKNGFVWRGAIYMLIGILIPLILLLFYI